MLKIAKVSTLQWPAAIFILGLLASAGLGLYVNNSNQEKISRTVAQEGLTTFDAISERLKLYEHGLKSVRSFVLATGQHNLTPQNFRQFILNRDLALDFPGARGFGFIERVTKEQEAAFIQKSQADISPDFAIRELTPHPGERFIIKLIEPLETNLTARGLDIASETQRREAAIKAMRHNKTALTGPITLVQATQSPLQSFLFLLPLYKTDAPLTAEIAREKAATAWVYMPLLIDEIMTGIRIDNSRTHFTLFDVTDPNDKRAFNQAPDDGLSIVTTYSIERDVYGRRWLLNFGVHPQFIAQMNLPSPANVFSWGALLSALLGLLAFTLRQNKIRDQQLFEKKNQLAAIVENSSDAIISLTLDEKISSWNKGAELMFGYSAHDVAGQSLDALIIPASLRSQEHKILARIKKREQIPTYESQRQRADGSLLDVAITNSILTNLDGALVGTSTILRNISAQKRHEKYITELNASLEQQIEQRLAELKKLNQLFASVLDSASEVSIIATDTDGIITVFNRGAENMLGYQAHEVIGKSSPAPFHLEEEVRKRALELSNEYGTPIEGFRTFVHKAEIIGNDTREWTYVKKNGQQFAVSLSISTLRNDENSFSGYLGIAIDISARKASLLSLAESLEMTRAILDTAIQPIISIDSQGKIRSINPAGIKAFGYQPDELIGQNVNILMPEPDRSQHDAYLARYLREKTPRMIGIGREVMARRKDASLFPAHLSVGALESKGQTLFVGIFADITLQTQQRNELIAARDQMILASEMAELGIWTWSLNDDVWHCNQRVFDIFELPFVSIEQGLPYQYWRSRIHPDDVEILDNTIHTASKEKSQNIHFLYRIIVSGERIRYIKAAGKLEYNAEGIAIRLTGINRDITQQQELEHYLRQAKEQADAANTAKSAFLANMSHEIRTPMNAILGLLQLIQKTTLAPSQQDYVDKAYSASKSLLEILNDILDYSKIESEKLELESRPFSLENLMRELAVVLAGNHVTNKVTLLFDMDQRLPPWCVGDSLRLKQVLINLASNALKFTPQGHVIIAIKVLQQHTDNVQLLFSVTDTGIGIKTEYQQNIFQAFTQAEISTSRRFGGSGLGLTICKHLLERMGSEIQLASEAGKGSCFWFELHLPLDHTQHVEQHCADEAPKRILLIEPDAMSQDLFAAAIRKAKWQVDAVHMLEVNQHFLRNAARYDAVLMNHPRNTEELNCIKTHVSTKTPLLIMQSAADKQSSPTWQDTSFSPIFLNKPFTPAQLLETLALAVSDQNAAPPSSSNAEEQRLKGLRVLVVEDHATNRMVLQLMLTDEGALVDLAEGGAEGIQKTFAAQPPYDVILMDMQMPDVDGLEATRRIRGHGSFNDVPIVAITANASLSDKQACLAAGMNEHLGKPFELNKLIAILQFLTRRVSAANVTPPPPIDTSDDLIGSATAVIRQFGKKPQRYLALLEEFQQESMRHLLHLNEHINHQDSHAALKILHTLKGSSGLINAKRLSERAAELEQQLKMPGQATLVEILNPTVQHELQHLLEQSVVRLSSILSHPAHKAPPTLNT